MLLHANGGVIFFLQSGLFPHNTQQALCGFKLFLFSYGCKTVNTIRAILFQKLNTLEAFSLSGH